MARYFFYLMNGDGLTADSSGLDISDRDELYRQAVNMVSDIAVDEIPTGDREAFTIKVRDGEGHYVFEASLSLRTAWLD